MKKNFVRDRRESRREMQTRIFHASLLCHFTLLKSHRMDNLHKSCLVLYLGLFKEVGSRAELRGTLVRANKGLVYI